MLDGVVVSSKQQKLIHQCADEIIRDCFWDYQLDEDGIVAIFEKNNPVEKRFLFTKIFANSTNVLKALEIFPLTEIKQFLDDFHTPHFNRDYLQRKRAIVRHVMLNEPVSVKELGWRK